MTQDKHRHKGSKSRKEEREEEAVAATEYRGRVTDAKDFAPVAKKVRACRTKFWRCPPTYERWMTSQHGVFLLPEDGLGRFRGVVGSKSSRTLIQIMG